VSSLQVVVPHRGSPTLARTLASLPELPTRVIHDQLGEGFARTANRGLAEAQADGADWVLLLNDDAVLQPGALEALLAARQPGVAVLGAVLDEGGGPCAGLDLGRSGRVRVRRSHDGGPTEVDAVSGACMLLTADLRFDPSFRHGMEDVELCRRVRAAGGRVLSVPGARCRHPGGATLSRRSPEAQRHAVSGHLRLVGGGWRTAWVLGLAVAQIIREGGPFSRLRAVAQGWLDAR
jgi:GT2 family glycosyltransferase